MKFSIVIATYNRSKMLGETLQSLVNSIHVDDEIEVLVINNNSPDNTEDVVLDYIGSTLSLKYIFEHKQGLSFARNRGVKEAQGEIIIFLDDDVDIDKTWITNIKKLFDSTAIIDIGGGKVLPYNEKIPTWLPENYYFLASIFNPSDTFTFTSEIMGANFFVKKSVFDKVGFFNTELGRKGNNLMAGEESDLVHRAIKAGFTSCYAPDIVVYHKINNKLNPEYILNYAFFLGRSSANYEKNNITIKFILKYFKNLVFIPYYLIKAVFCKELVKNCISNTIKKEYAKGYLSFWKLDNV